MPALKGADLLVLLKLAAHPEKRGPTSQKSQAVEDHKLGLTTWSYASLAESLKMSTQTVHEALRHVSNAKLYDAQERKPIRRNLLEFLLHGAKYSFPPARGELTRGIPTSYAGSPLASQFAQGDHPPVWPFKGGMTVGTLFEPIYGSVPHAALADPALSELLVLLDAIRDGQARVAGVAAEELQRRLKSQ